MIVKSLRLFPIFQYSNQINSEFDMFDNASEAGRIRAVSIQDCVIKLTKVGTIGILNGNWCSIRKISSFKWRSETIDNILYACKNVGFMS